MLHQAYVNGILIMWAVGMFCIGTLTLVAMHFVRKPASSPAAGAVATPFDDPELLSRGFHFDSTSRSWSLDDKRKYPARRRTL